MFRSSHSDEFLWKGVLKICNKFTGEHLCRSKILGNLLCNFIEIALRHGCSPVNLLDIFKIHFSRTSPKGCVLELLHSHLWCPLQFVTPSLNCTVFSSSFLTLSQFKPSQTVTINSFAVTKQAVLIPSLLRSQWNS